MNASQQAMLREALNAPPPSDFGGRVVALSPSPGSQAIFAPFVPTPSTSPGRASSGEASGGPPASRIDRQYSSRRGYSSRFLPGFPVPMPQLDGQQRSQAARVRGIGESENPFELKYEHFSVMLNAERRMAIFSICNIDGSKRIHVNRDTGQAVSEPEATETWATDPRVPEETQLSDAFYARLRRDLRISDFFARGHLTRREDPNWGTAPAAERANNDTYHHPNACPQVNNAFNASQKAWQGI
ncbi:MAG: DNA/RNA non-specific endonuclease, partial [Bryobacteraceae bacterium]